MVLTDNDYKVIKSGIRAITKDEDEFNDVRQDVIIKLLNTSFEKIDNRTALIYTVARNTAIDHYRKRHTRPLPFSNLRMTPGNNNDGGWEHNYDAYDFLENKVLIDPFEDEFDPMYGVSKAKLAECIERLSDSCRKAIKLYYFGGYKHHEIGQLLGISTETSKTNLMKGRQKLLKMILNK